MMKITLAMPNVHEAMRRAPNRRAISPTTRKIIANVSNITILLSNYVITSYCRQVERSEINRFWEYGYWCFLLASTISTPISTSAKAQKPPQWNHQNRLNRPARNSTPTTIRIRPTVTCSWYWA